MFTSIKNWFRKPTVESSLDYYSPEQRNIFAYFNGAKVIKADPAPLWERVMEQSSELQANFKAASIPSQWQKEANANIVKYMREVFEIPKLEDGWKIPADGSLTSEEVINLFNVFMTFCGMVKKNSSDGPTLPETTSVASDNSSADRPPTLNFSGCGSTAAGIFTAPSAPSSLASPLPLETSAPETTTGTT